MDWIMIFLAVAAIGTIGIWILIAKTVWADKKEKTVGKLKIYADDPDGPYMFLELHTPIEEVMGSETVTLSVSILKVSQ